MSSFWWNIYLRFIGSCHFDNFQFSQWYTFHQNEDISISVNLTTHPRRWVTDIAIVRHEYLRITAISLMWMYLPNHTISSMLVLQISTPGTKRFPKYNKRRPVLYWDYPIKETSELPMTSIWKKINRLSSLRGNLWQKKPNCFTDSEAPQCGRSTFIFLTSDGEGLGLWKWTCFLDH